MLASAVGMDENARHLDYASPRPIGRRSVAQRVVFALAVLSILPMLVTGLATVDGFFNPHSDFAFGPWAVLFALSCTFPALSIWLRQAQRRRA
jgi:hypothetical protein